ncbi:MAG TPA: CHRD domain-containing protein [Vicinamibacteria bacterium]|nr:CHRD domain-containing protein [Vicinamibacteria bacterium]
MRRQGLTVVLMALAAGGIGCDRGSDGQEVFQATLSGQNEVPVRGTAASGMAGITFDGTNVAFSIEVDDINEVTQAHIHSGAAGVNGPVRVFLFPPPPANAPTTNAFSASERSILTDGFFVASDVSGVTFDQLLNEMRAGTAYVNVHTRRFPGGEIRGQVRLVDTN